MCGICGIYNYRTMRPVQKEDIGGMRRVMVHRGPDGAGDMVRGPIGLGHNRLSIIDLEGGSQPMFADDDSLCIVFNGEIYNYLELRSDLLKKGKAFHTTSDTEVLIRMYEEYGENCLDYLNGMFAFAIWDDHKKTLFLARDRVGIKPLYYAETSDGLAFGSEIKALLQLSSITPMPNIRAIDHVLSFGYTLGSDTIFQGITKVMPGEYICIKNKRLERKTYWDVYYNVNEKKDESCFVEKLRSLFGDSVQKEMRSDVPVGVFLSGGVDSSAVVAYLNKKLQRRIKTFSISYDKGKEFDESPYSSLIAKQFQTDHYHMYLDPQEFVEFIPKLAWYLEEPIAEPPAISLYYVSKLASEHVKVVLSGEGSDEIFAGYLKYYYFKVFEMLQVLPSFLKGYIFSQFLRVTPSRRIKRMHALINAPVEQRYLGGHSLDQSFRDMIYTEEMKKYVRDTFEIVRTIYQKTSQLDILSRMLYLDMKTWLPDNLLLKADRMSMANSVELRVPFLDHRMIEFAAEIPARLKLRGKETKYILKKTLSDLLPPEILFRKKMGFPVPIASILRNEGKELLMDILFSKKAQERGYFDYKFIKQSVAEHMSGKHDHQYLLWQLLSLEIWHRTFIDKGESK